MTREQFDHTVQEIVEQVIIGYQPQQVILFGSVAEGTATGDSDIDLLIVKETNETPLNRRVQVRRLVQQSTRRVPFSPLVVTPTELKSRLAIDDPFYKSIMSQGKVLYACN